MERLSRRSRECRGSIGGAAKGGCGRHRYFCLAADVDYAGGSPAIPETRLQKRQQRPESCLRYSAFPFSPKTGDVAQAFLTYTLMPRALLAMPTPRR
jgi:hypothetical protein